MAALVLSAPKVLLVAVELAAKADIDSLSYLAAQHGSVLRKDVLLRILLTYLPETLQSEHYVSFIEEVEEGVYHGKDVDIDYAAVEKLSDEEAARKVRKLHLLPLSWPDAPPDASEDFTTLFLIRRAYKVDDEAGLLDELPGLLVPFLDHSPCIRSLMISAILPLLRRNCEYYPAQPIPQTLSAFEHFPDRAAVSLLLSETGTRGDDYVTIGRDLRGLVGPWLYNEKHWKSRAGERGRRASSTTAGASSTEGSLCPGWEQVLEWLTMQASKSWRVAVCAVDQWDGPRDADLGGYGVMWLNDQEQEHLARTYARAALASAYLIPEASIEALSGAHTIVTKVVKLLDQDPTPPLQSAASMLSPILGQDIGHVLSARNATYLRNDLLGESNILTSPTKPATQLLHGLILSAFFLTRSGSPCTVRRAGELALLQDEREQKAEAVKLIHNIGGNGSKSDDKYWIKARNEVLWLRDWGSEEDSPSPEYQVKGVFGQLKKEFLEVEILKALLANTRYSLARSLYEDSPDLPLPKKVLQDTIFAAALNAFDNASNPNRTRGGLKKCDDMIKAFPQTIEKSLPATRRIEALLKATHSLGEYRLVLKQGEPFTPVVLRVHADPISIIGKILEQNPKSYTRIQDLVDLGTYLVEAGLTVRDKPRQGTPTAEEQTDDLSIAERRVTAMCIDAALSEDDFETAYSYVVGRLSAINEPARAPPRRTSQRGPGPTASPPARIADDYSWKAALQAGKYRRTARTLRPTHLGTASANPDIRHLEQRAECLAAALRAAPAPTLQEIVNAFRRCEEELDAAVKADAERERAWDAAGDGLLLPGGATPMPGGFGVEHRPPGGGPRGGPSSSSSSSRQQQAEEAPMSLFDLSRASVRSAQRNLTALSGLRHTGGGGAGKGGDEGSAMASSGELEGDGEDGGPKRARKRDQLREAAMGTLVSGVGWLINAGPTPSERHDSE